MQRRHFLAGLVLLPALPFAAMPQMRKCRKCRIEDWHLSGHRQADVPAADFRDWATPFAQSLGQR